MKTLCNLLRFGIGWPLLALAGGLLIIHVVFPILDFIVDGICAILEYFKEQRK